MRMHDDYTSALHANNATYAHTQGSDQMLQSQKETLVEGNLTIQIGSSRVYDILNVNIHSHIKNPILYFQLKPSSSFNCPTYQLLDQDAH